MSDGVTEIRFVEEYHLEISHLQQIKNITSPISDNQPLYLLIVPGASGSITKEAREEPMATKNTKAVAIIANLIHQRILGNLYFKFKNQHSYSNKLFRSENAALKWLYEQMSVK